MTVCIAAISRRDNTIVTVTDLLLSTSSASLDTDTVKIQDLAEGWLSMFAGDPSAEASIVRRVRDSLVGSTHSLPDVANALTEAFRAELRVKIDGEILSPYGLDRDSFLAEGRVQLGDDEFSRLMYRIGASDLDTEFLVGGFEANQVPRIFSVSNPGVWTQHTSLGFHAIGVGRGGAVGSLFATYNRRLSTTELIYRACEAKFRAEGAPGVGKKTYVVVIETTGEQRSLHPDNVAHLRTVWEREGIPPVPPEAVSYIRDHLLKLTWSDAPPLKKPLA